MELFDFQRIAVTKLAAVPARLIGDDMGLGKTVTAIALDIEARKKFKETYPGYRSPPTLVVAPMSVLSSWADHFADWAPHLKVFVIDRKDRPTFIRAVEDKTYDVYICHWEALRLMPQLNMRKWLHIIGDEIHRISSRNSQLTNAFRLIRSEEKTGMSGTPMQTRPQDLWSPLNWLYPRLFTSYWNFFKRHVVYTHHTVGPCQADGCFKLHKNSYRELQGVANAGELKTVMEPFFIRRLKEEVALELPDKYYSVIRVGLDPKQRKAYNQMRDDMLAWIGEHEDEPLAAPVAVAKLVRLQQLAGAYAEIRKEIVYVRGPVADGGRRIDRSYVLNPDGSRKTQVIDIVRLTDPSTKLDAVMQILEDNPNKQVGIFSVSRQMIELLAARLEKKNISYGMLTGNTPQQERGQLVKNFQVGNRQVFIATIAAGGVGLTLTAASTAIFLDRDWSPARNAQAEDRFHRIGQKNAVHIIDIIATDTVDMGKLQHLEQTWSWLKQLLGDKVMKRDLDRAEQLRRLVGGTDV